MCSHCHYCCLLTILLMLHIPSTHRYSAVLHGAPQFQLGFPYKLTREKPSYCLALQKKQEKERGAGEQDGELKNMIDTARKREHGKGRGKPIEWDKKKERRGRHRLNVRHCFHSSYWQIDAITDYIHSKKNVSTHLESALLGSFLEPNYL